MSVQTNGATEIISDSENTKLPSKKRKHDGTSRESAKKKRKNLEKKERNPQETLVSTQKKSKKTIQAELEEVENKITVAEGDQSEIEDAELPDASVVNDNAELDAFNLEEEILDADILDSNAPSSFYSTRISFYVPVPAVSLSTASPSLLAIHLSPLLLTYFPPAKGIVLAFSDPVLSAKSDSEVNLPLLPPHSDSSTFQEEVETLARAADEFGVCWIWLTATLLIFRPQRGDEMKGWTNVTSEGLIGLVSYNYFQSAVGKTRIPHNWTWNGPAQDKVKKKSRKMRLRDEGDDITSQQPEENEDLQPNPVSSEQGQIDSDIGVFLDEDGVRIPQTLTYHVVDTEMIPTHEKDRWSIQISGTLLDAEAEKTVIETEHPKFERLQHPDRSRTPAADRGNDVVMSGGLALSRDGSISSAPTPNRRHRVAY